ncbi:MAG: hydrogenase maturation nickel metallochaperone HypA [Bryobacteraceae bacterium]|nr:hydrogenase maturation nickel metallochaperone HypA [Bryobacteraceae bacterium]
MHELGIAQAVIDLAQSQLNGRPPSALRAIGLRLGEVSGVEKDSLSFCFECLVKDTEIERVQLKIELCPLRYRCLDCGREIAGGEWQAKCPSCGATSLAGEGGDELELAYLELEAT